MQLIAHGQCGFVVLIVAQDSDSIACFLFSIDEKVTEAQNKNRHILF